MEGIGRKWMVVCHVCSPLKKLNCADAIHVFLSLRFAYC